MIFISNLDCDCKIILNCIADLENEIAAIKKTPLHFSFVTLDFSDYLVAKKSVPH
jgi:hypothetical protein